MDLEATQPSDSNAHLGARLDAELFIRWRLDRNLGGRPFGRRRRLRKPWVPFVMTPGERRNSKTQFITLSFD